MVATSYKMCTKCQDIIRGCKVKHQPMHCPLMAASYCGICATYGHTTMMCPDTQVLEHRKPEFIEQLIPTSILDAYNIQTTTPLANKDTEMKSRHEPVLEVYDTDKNIRAILMNYNKPIANKSKDNRIRIQKLADELGRKLVYLTPVEETSKKSAS